MTIKQKNKTYLWAFVTCILFFLVWEYFIPEMTSFLSRDFTYEAELLSSDNFYDEQLDKYSGEQHSVAIFSYNLISPDEEGGILQIKNKLNVKTLDGKEIINLERIYGIDRKTGKHVSGFGDRDRQGYLFAPQNLRYGEEFIYWHINYDGPAKMHFVKETKLYGLKVYEYQADYELVHIDQTDDLHSLPGVGDTRGVEVSPQLTIWVEPTTGYLIKYEDSSTAYYYDLKTRETIAPWNKFKNEYTEASVVRHVSRAFYEKNTQLIVSSFVPVGTLVLAIVFLTLFFVVKRGDGHTRYKLPRDQRAMFILFLVLFSVSVAVFARWFFQNANTEYARAEFESRISEINENILEQFNTRTNILRGARGLFDASEKVTNSEWKKFVDSLDILNNFIGISSLRFASYVKDEDKENHERDMKDMLGRDYKIWPEGRRDRYLPVTFYEPRTEAGDRVFGFDIYSDIERSEAVERANNTGDIAISGPVSQIFPNDLDTSARILIYLPVYDKNLPYETAEEKLTATKGYVYSSFRMQSFMESIYGVRNGIINIEVFDTDNETDLKEEKLLYTNNTNYNFGVTYNSKFVRLARLSVGGRSWIIRYSSTPDFGLDLSQRFFPPVLIVSGILLYIFVLFLVYELFAMRSKALVMLEEESKKCQSS